MAAAFTNRTIRSPLSDQFLRGARFSLPAATTCRGNMSNMGKSRVYFCGAAGQVWGATSVLQGLVDHFAIQLAHQLAGNRFILSGNASVELSNTRLHCAEVCRRRQKGQTKNVGRSSFVATLFALQKGRQCKGMRAEMVSIQVGATPQG